MLIDNLLVLSKDHIICLRIKSIRIKTYYYYKKHIISLTIIILLRITIMNKY